MNYTSMAGTLLLLLTLGIGAAAADSDDNGDQAEDAVELVPVVVDARACLTLTEATGARGVAPANGAAYVPGVDARGGAVVPAEGPGGARDWSLLGETVVIDLNLELIERYGVVVPPGTSLPLGTLEVRPGGRVWFNGQPIAGADREALWEACRRLGALQGAADERKPSAPR